MRALPTIALLSLLTMPVAFGQTRDENWARCVGSDLDMAIGGCTALIQSGTEKDSALLGDLIIRGNAYSNKKDFDRAVADYDEAIRLSPISTIAFYNRGTAYLRKKDYDRAIQDLDRAIQLNPNYAPAYNSRGLVYFNKKDYDRAVADYDEAIRMGPVSAISFYNRGNAFLQKRDYDRAIPDLDRAIQLNANYALAYQGRGVTYYYKSDYDRAIQDLDRAIQLTPNYASAYNVRGRTYFQKSDYDRAIQDLDEAVRLDPNEVSNYTVRAFVYDHAGDYDRSLADYDEAIRLYPKGRPAFLGRGLIHLKLRQFEDAQQDFEQAVKLDSTDPVAAVWLYIARASEGQDGRAELERNASQVNLKAWPGQLVNLYLGRTTPAAILAAASDPDTKKDREQHCVAYFFIGEQALLAKKVQDAKSLFQQAIHTDVTGYSEFAFAQWELGRLQGGQLATTASQRGFTSDLPSPSPELNVGKYYALVIGINQYPAPLPRLKTAVGDAQAMAKVLRDRYGFQVKLLLDGQATRANILQAITQYRNNLGESDNLLIYYAGHGFSDRDADKAYWLPVDADSSESPNRIIADDLTSDVKVQAARHVLIISDSCYSGGLSRDADVIPRGSDQQIFLKKMLNGRSRTLMSSGGDEPVSDAGTAGHSVFAYAVLHALEGTSGDMFTASDLFYNSVRQQVAGKSNQVPQYSIIRNSNHDEGDFVFVRKPVGPR